MDIVDYINNLNKDEISKFIETTNSDIRVLQDIEKKVSDTSWMDMIEECIPYLDNIIRNPRRFIVQEENIVPIEKAKVVTEESIRHLAQNTNLIQEVHEDGTVIPLKLLNVYREETVDLYENRFIKSLVDNLYMFVQNKLSESDQKSYAKIKNTVTYSGTTKLKNGEFKINVSLEGNTNDEFNEKKDGHTIEERIEHIRDVLGAFRNSTFIKSLKESSPVRSPIRKTNVILKEPNFIKALELWEYLEKNNIVPMTSIVKETKESKDITIKDKYDLGFYIASAALKEQKDKETIVYNEAIISKLINDFVFSGNISDKEFKALVNKEFKEASKRKEKILNSIDNKFKDFIDNYEKKSKKAFALLK